MGMDVKFKGGAITYRVITESVIEYDEIEERYCECHELEVLGFVSVDNVVISEEPANAIDFYLAIKGT